MANTFITTIESWFSEIKTAFTSSTAVQTAVSDVETIAISGWNYIKTNGLTDVYQLALALLTGAATGTPWATLSATLVTQSASLGKTLLSGEESIILSQAQADLIAAGKLVAPSSGALIATPTPIAAASTSSASGASAPAA